MSSTNKTANLELSQFLGSDSPKWLTDYNADMQKIDAGYATVKSQADATDLTVSGLSSTVTSLSNTVGDQTTSIQSIRGDVTSLQGQVNTINSLIGNGEPTTTDKTLIGAINELKEDIDAIAPAGSVDAEDVGYDNTSSGLAATNVQAAIDEVKGLIPSIVSNTEVQRGTLTAGQTSVTLTFTNQTIGTDSLIDWYVSDPSINPTAITTTSTTVVFTFAAQASNLRVGAKVQN